MMEQEETSIVVAGRVEIDTRPPFKSVREAVLLFGERVLAGEVIANKLKEIRAVNETAAGATPSRKEALKAELGEAKKDLQRAREENKALARRIESVLLELEETRRELNRLKQARSHDLQKQASLEPEFEDVKFVENLTRVETVKKRVDEEEDEDEAEGFRFYREEEKKNKKKKLVKFASSPTLTKVIVSTEDEESDSNNALQRTPPLKKKRSGTKKPLIGLMGWFLSKKKVNQEDEY